jgi:hypothetical protein
MVLENGEFVHIVEHRRFESDVRRHFVGKVVACDQGHFRVSGFIFRYNLASGQFEKIEEPRERVFVIDNMISLTVLPPTCDLERMTYERYRDELYLTDFGDVRLEIGAFGGQGSDRR